MTTTLSTREHLGRLLTNATPGTSDATDPLGRAVGAGDTDYVGRPLIPVRANATAYTVGDQVTLGDAGKSLLYCTVAGTSHATTPPTAPGVGNTVTDGTVTWEQIR